MISTKVTIFLVTIRTYGTLIENFIDQHNFRTEDNEIHCSKILRVLAYCQIQAVCLFLTI